MKLKFTQAGYENFSGDFGGIDFVNGVSTEDVDQGRAKMFSALLSVEWDNDGTTIGPNADYAVNMHQPAVLVDCLTLAQIQAQAPVVKEVEVVIPASFYTKEELEAVADKSGIEGLRKIGDPIGAKGTGIVKLIQNILQAQANEVQRIQDYVEAKPQPEAEVEG